LPDLTGRLLEATVTRDPVGLREHIEHRKTLSARRHRNGTCHAKNRRCLRQLLNNVLRQRLRNKWISRRRSLAENTSIISGHDSPTFLLLRKAGSICSLLTEDHNLLA